MSGNGEKLAAVDGDSSGGHIYTSTDKGASWARRTSAGNRNWQSIAVSSNGDELAAVAWGGHIYYCHELGGYLDVDGPQYARGAIACGEWDSGS